MEERGPVPPCAIYYYAAGYVTVVDAVIVVVINAKFAASDADVVCNLLIAFEDIIKYDVISMSFMKYLMTIKLFIFN